MRIAPWLTGMMVVAVGTSALGQIGSFRGRSAAATQLPTDTFGHVGGNDTRTTTGWRGAGRSVATVPSASGKSFGYRSYGGAPTGFASPQQGMMVGRPFQYAPTAGGGTSAASLGRAGYAQYATPQASWGQQGQMPDATGLADLPIGADAQVESGTAAVETADALLRGPTAGQAADRRMNTLRNDYLNQAIQQFRDGQYKEARVMFEIVDAIEFSHGAGQLGTVHAFFADGQYDSAMAAFKPLLDGGVNLFGQNFATTLYSDPTTLTAHLAQFRPVIAAATTNPSVQAFGAYLLWTSGERRAAVIAAQRAHQLAPGEPKYGKLLQMITAAEKTLAGAATASK